MKLLLALVLTLTSLPLLARYTDCYSGVSQAEKNECMLYQKDLAIGRFMSEVTQSCAEQDDIEDSRGGSLYPMLLDECIARKMDALSRLMKREKN